MGQVFVQLLALLSLSRGCQVPVSSRNATRDLIRVHGTGGALSREEFSRLGLATQSGWEVMEDDATGINNFCSCQSYNQIFQEAANGGNRMNESALVAVCPLLLAKFHSKDCCANLSSQTAVQEHAGKLSIGQAWGYGIGFVTLVVLISNIGVFLGPCMKTKVFKRILMFCVALAVGTLASTGLMVLIPESMDLAGKNRPLHESGHSLSIPDFHLKMASVLGGAYFVFIAERILKFVLNRRKRSNSENETELDVNEKNGKVELLQNNPHSHSHNLDSVQRGSKKEVAPVAWILLIGDAIHNFVDGLSIGAAFTENTLLGISVSLAVICEELPHELGDIAILLHAGLTMKKALLFNFIAAAVCYIGLILGIVVGENTSANQWIFGIAGGIFVYIALADMVPEMREQLTEAEISETENIFLIFFIQNIGLVLGFVIILCLVQFSDQIQV